jgi:RimJ/RimL family protein N-acetyltransferase
MTSEFLLRDVIESDLPILFEHQRDPEANDMAAFAARDWNAFMAHWTRVLADETISKKTILVDGRVAGNIVSYVNDAGEREVGYWIGREFWGRGLATGALSQFLDQVRARPLYARVAKHNVASIRLLEKCGFTITGQDDGSSDAPGAHVEELVLTLGA